MAEYRICFSIAGEFGVEISFEANPDVPYENTAKFIDKEKLAKMLCLEDLGHSIDDVKIITPEQYDVEFGGGRK